MFQCSVIDALHIWNHTVPHASLGASCCVHGRVHVRSLGEFAPKDWETFQIHTSDEVGFQKARPGAKYFFKDLASAISDIL